jgi:hypothetical protein
MMMSTQQIDLEPTLKIKFAIPDETGNYSDYAIHNEYSLFFREMAEAWQAEEVGLREPGQGGWRRASTFSRDNVQIAATAHETGVEILVEIGVSVAGSVGTALIVGFAKWAWNKWQTTAAAEGTTAPISLVIEQSVEQLPGGLTRTTTKKEIHLPHSEQDVGRLVESFLKG